MSLQEWKKQVESTEVQLPAGKWVPIRKVLDTPATVWDLMRVLHDASSIRQKVVGYGPDKWFCSSCSHRFTEDEYAYARKHKPGHLFQAVMSPREQCHACWDQYRHVMEPIESDQVCRYARPAEVHPDAFGIVQCRLNKDAHGDHHDAGDWFPLDGSQPVRVTWPVA